VSKRKGGGVRKMRGEASHRGADKFSKYIKYKSMYEAFYWSFWFKKLMLHKLVDYNYLKPKCGDGSLQKRY